MALDLIRLRARPSLRPIQSRCDSGDAEESIDFPSLSSPIESSTQPENALSHFAFSFFSSSRYIPGRDRAWSSVSPSHHRRYDVSALPRLHLCVTLPCSSHEWFISTSMPATAPHSDALLFSRWHKPCTWFRSFIIVMLMVPRCTDTVLINSPARIFQVLVFRSTLSRAPTLCFSDKFECSSKAFGLLSKCTSFDPTLCATRHSKHMIAPWPSLCASSLPSLHFFNRRTNTSLLHDHLPARHQRKNSSS